MKNKAKKALAFALAGTMAASNFSFASASELTTSEKLEVLMDLGIIKGDSTDDDSLDLNSKFNRSRSIILFLRLLDKAEDMEDYDYEGEPSFADAGEYSSYVERLMAYVYNNDVGVDGLPDGTFGPLDEITDKSFAKIMLEALGYEYNEDFTWKQVASLAEEVGIVEDADEIDDEAALFGEMVEMNFNTLAANVKGENITLGEKLGKPVVETELRVDAVETDNLKQIFVKFNKPVDEDKATDIDNYDLDSKNADLKDGSVKLINDTTVVINLGTPAKQQEISTLTIKDIKAENGKTIEKTEVEVSFLDQSIPSVKDAEVVGSKTIKVTFSEPMENVDKSHFTVKDGSKKLYINNVEAVNSDRTEFYVSLYSSLKDGEIAITVDDAEDYAGFNVIKDTISLDVVEDQEAPEVIDYKDATPNKVTLIFNEDITIKDSDLKNFYHTNYKNTATSVTVEGNELTLSFVDNTLPEGRAYIYIDDEAIADLWGNENDQIMTKIDVEVDEQAPVIKEVDVKSEDQIVIEFNEELDEKVAEDRDNYTLLDNKGKEQKLISRISYEDMKVTVNFSENLSGDYTIVMEDIEDLSGNKMDDEIEFTVEDLTAPEFDKFIATIYNAGDKEQIIKVSFGEEMTTEGKYSVADEDNYMINNEELSDIEDAYIDVVDNGKSVEIHVPNKSEGGIDITSDDTLNMARVADVAGNYTTALSGALDIQPSATVNIDKVEATDRETIVVTFDDTLTDIDSNDIIVTTNNADATSAQAAKLEISSLNVDEDEDGNSILTMTLANELRGDATSNGSNVYVYVIGTESHNAYDEPLQVNENKDAEDKIKPELVKDDSAIVDTQTVNLKFTEDLDATANLSLVATDLNITVDGEKLVAGVDYTVSIDNDVLTIHLQNDIEIVDDITIQVNDKVNYLADTAVDGNVVEELDITLELE